MLYIKVNAESLLVNSIPRQKVSSVNHIDGFQSEKWSMECIGAVFIVLDAECSTTSSSNYRNI